MIVVVSNLARAGSSCTMQMLSAGGYPCVGKFPSFEVDLDNDRNWIRNCEGMALKIIDPHHYPPPPGHEYRVIWIDRDIRQQAKSTMKAQRALTDLENVHRSQLRDMERLIREQRRPALDTWAELGAKVLPMRFERIIRSPRESAEDMASFLRLDLDTKRMAEAVVKRRPSCLPYMLEFRQLREH